MDWGGGGGSIPRSQDSRERQLHVLGQIWRYIPVWVCVSAPMKLKIKLYVSFYACHLLIIWYILCLTLSLPSNGALVLRFYARILRMRTDAPMGKATLSLLNRNVTAWMIFFFFFFFSPNAEINHPHPRSIQAHICLHVPSPPTAACRGRTLAAAENSVWPSPSPLAKFPASRRQLLNSIILREKALLGRSPSFLTI